MIMVCASVAELLIQYKIICIALKSLFQQSRAAINAATQKRGKRVSADQCNIKRHTGIVEDPALPKDQVKDWMWILGLFVTIVIAMVIYSVQWVRSSECQV
jgi:hypothetical protein